MPSLVAEMNRITRNTADVPDDFGLFEGEFIHLIYQELQNTVAIEMKMPRRLASVSIGTSRADGSTI